MAACPQRSGAAGCECSEPPQAEHPSVLQAPHQSTASFPPFKSKPLSGSGRRAPVIRSSMSRSPVRQHSTLCAPPPRGGEE